MAQTNIDLGGRDRRIVTRAATVGDFVVDVAGALALHDGGCLLGREPREELEQLAHLAGERHGEVLGRVELLPVAGCGSRGGDAAGR